MRESKFLLLLFVQNVDCKDGCLGGMIDLYIKEIVVCAVSP